ncbi:3-isopropylmalate dehydrogenase [Altererythrobacter lutimaris]|uniref:3-isopropylmalate dehydrogenase n=1 Tax=Altererythrobacter lutimaris TaxID=2743979 RepID=A0A850HC58_9SPHN|nr:3-isopropylmalate dehydrogenase [Altererythrobacter lutimaris]NVE94198.1 3-isopropylmalate dehydrogenase [Altererythrobacter lutimaris]
MKIAVLPGDGIGTEVTAEALKVLDALGLDGIELVHGEVGAAGYRAKGHPLPPETLELARSSDAILFGAVGDPSCDDIERHLRPEQAVLGLRKELGLFANLRPAKAFAGLEDMSALKPDVARDIDMVIVRELTGDVYFGEKSREILPDGRREGWDRMNYAEDEVRRIAHIAFQTAAGRAKHVTSVDKANVLETSRLWREVVEEVATKYPDIALEHMYVDNAAMQLVKAPGALDVVLTGNLFGDILSDQASMCVGSIGLLASASLGERTTQYGTFGLYEPIHGSAPDIAGQGKANPMATILSAAMMLRHSFGLDAEADRIETAVASALVDGVLGGDLGGNARTSEIGDAVVSRLVTTS